MGLDPDPKRIPDSVLPDLPVADRIVAFNKAIISATADLACAYKLNLAFYELHGAAGWEALRQTREELPEHVVAIADAKRGDIGNTARFYAETFYGELSFDACTVSPYMGLDSVAPFAAFPGRCTFVLCRTSNATADDFQLVGTPEPLYIQLARRANDWNDQLTGSVGLVVGATRVDDLAAVRAVSPRLPFLVPGVGAQGGDPKSTVAAAHTETGPILVNSSRSILYAASGPNFVEAAREEAHRLALALAVR